MVTARGVLITAAAVGAIGGAVAYDSHVLGQGISIENVVLVANLIGDETPDVLYSGQDNHSLNSVRDSLFLVDGRDVSRRGEGYLRHTVPIEALRGLERGKRYSAMAVDFNGDRKPDLQLREIFDDVMMTLHAPREVYLGNGRGGFSFSQEHSTTP